MRVLVTRPLHSGERTAERLREMGHEPLLLPLSQAVHDADTALLGLARTDGAIAVTSAEAIRAIAPFKDELARHLQRPLFAVGEATAEEAKSAGFRSVVASSGSGTDLADAIAHLGHDPVLYLAGFPRAETFEARGGELSLNIMIAECYRMVQLPVDPARLKTILAEQRPASILFYSQRTAESFFDLAGMQAHPEKIAGIRLLCLSAAVAAVIPASLRENIAIAEMPEERSLLSLL
ncbi:uroporphyrinogen III synthase [Rhizobium sp. Root1203]|uniref:uroporphyrinogen-III synthase n=1 Tax=Rhizobium sp. Root1203 TaxID=1736427 RepID=UPI00070A83F2|nr:uroporphyrinogen-III synthase [Rhizobium sp. Root1203]KQV20488.1 uroporphyrinogen III synthase [Rhizobium sp. Root1203]